MFMFQAIAMKNYFVTRCLGEAQLNMWIVAYYQATKPEYNYLLILYCQVNVYLRLLLIIDLVLQARCDLQDINYLRLDEGK